MKFHEIPSSGSGFITSGRKEGQTDRHDELIVAFSNFANAPKTRKMMGDFIL